MIIKLLKQQNATDGLSHWFSTENYDDGGDLIVHESRSNNTLLLERRVNKE